MGYRQQFYQKHKGMMKTLIKDRLQYSINEILKFGLIHRSAASPVFLKMSFLADQTSIAFLFNVAIT